MEIDFILHSDKSNLVVKLLISVATYNEMENLPSLVAEIFEFAPYADLLVVDDNSPDGTGQWCGEQGQIDGRLRCVRRRGKLGLGSAIIAAMRYAIDQRYDALLNMDADFSHHPRYIPDLFRQLEESGNSRVDVAIGSRYVPGGGVKGWPLHRHLMSRAVNYYARCLLGLPVKDSSGAFRCYRIDALKKLDFDSIRSQGYSFQEEILWRLKRAGATFREVPIVFVDREKGSSKIDSREARNALRIIFRLGLQNWLKR